MNIRKSFTVILLLTFFNSFLVSAQSRKVKNMIKEIKNELKINTEGNAFYKKTITVNKIKREKMFSDIINFLVKGSNVTRYDIQYYSQENRAITAKGVYNNVFTSANLIGIVNVDCENVLEARLKENSLEITITLIRYKYKTEYYDITESLELTPFVRERYPLSKNKLDRNKFGKAFYMSHKISLEIFESIKNIIHEDKSKKEPIKS